ncbi:hypothetical protein CD134_08935 [Staphylococcus lutrae]|uniref:Uncharacterized protein n=1 Tax=Staphylococcus lutrae TaxID=155085 RepID=A0AAC9RUA5_9STAP|nr:hypothetical protein B5P37_08540 [Staphylococcus lutrae]PNZ35863.1 hypothetical protein CD134_08935 [Staphylococcus lutrae]
MSPFFRALWLGDDLFNHNDITLMLECDNSCPSEIYNNFKINASKIFSHYFIYNGIVNGGYKM